MLNNDNDLMVEKEIFKIHFLKRKQSTIISDCQAKKGAVSRTRRRQQEDKQPKSESGMEEEEEVFSDEDSQSQTDSQLSVKTEQEKSY